VDETIYFVLQIMDTVMPLSKTLRWVKDVPTRRLLTDKRFSFPSCYEVDGLLPHYQIILSTKIATKGFMIVFNDKNFVFPLNCFDHD
jgi:hypothetical protein